MTRHDEPARAEAELGPNRDFTEAVVAVCVLAAGSDETLKQCEVSCVQSLMSDDPGLQGLDAAAARALFEDFARRLREDGAKGRAWLSEKVMRMAGDRERSLRLMRMAHRVFGADHNVDEAEMREFARLCRLLDLDPEFVWRDSASRSAQARDFGVL